MASNIATHSIPDTFYPFARLPFELRALIWRSTIAPRIVDLSASIEFIKYRRLLPISPTPVPAPLQTCREARAELSRYYERTLTELDIKEAECAQNRRWRYSMDVFHLKHSQKQPRYIWAHLEIDIIDIGELRHLLDFDHYTTLAPRVRRLKFAVRWWTCSLEWKISKLVEIFCNVRQVFVVCINDDWRRWVRYVTDEWNCGKDNVWLIDGDGDAMRSLTGKQVVREKAISYLAN